MQTASSEPIRYKGRYGTKYLIELEEDNTYVLFCMNSELKNKKEVLRKQSFFKGSASECLIYLKTIEKEIETY